jgi:glycosyltransferase involved in cell wall biosynthesis
MESPTISVVMPVYNTAKYINEAIDSILNQTFTDFEFIIIDDCSTDGSLDIIKTYSDERIILIQNESNQGVVYSLNNALSIANGKYIARMDSDDISKLDRFEKQLSYFYKNPNIELIGSFYHRIDSFGNTLDLINYPYFQEDIKFGLLFSCVLAHPTIFFKRSLIDLNYFKYDQNYFPAEDYFLWTNLISKVKIANINECLLKYRVTTYQISSLYSEDQIKITNLIRVRYLLSLYPNFTIYEKSLLNFWNCDMLCSYKNVSEALFVFNYIFNSENNQFCKNKISELFHTFININHKRFPKIIFDFKMSDIYHYNPYTLKEKFKFYFLN